MLSLSVRLLVLLLLVSNTLTLLGVLCGWRNAECEGRKFIIIFSSINIFSVNNHKQRLREMKAARFGLICGFVRLILCNQDELIWDHRMKQHDNMQRSSFGAERDQTAGEGQRGGGGGY